MLPKFHVLEAFLCLTSDNSLWIMGSLILSKIGYVNTSPRHLIKIIRQIDIPAFFKVAF